MSHSDSLGICRRKRYNQGMHTHFGSATHGAATFLHVLLFGTFWRIGWLHVLSVGVKRGSKSLQGFAKAALFQFG